MIVQVKLVATVVGLLILSGQLPSLVCVVNLPHAVLEGEDGDYRRLYDEELLGVMELLNRTFQSPEAAVLRDVALEKYKDAVGLAEKKSWRKAYETMRESYTFLSDAVHTDERYLKDVKIALVLVLPILVLLHVVYLAYRHYRRTSKRLDLQCAYVFPDKYRFSLL